MKQAIVHVGLHRCASTSIQKMLEAIRPQIEAADTDLILRSDLKADRRLNEFRSIPRHDTKGIKGWWRARTGCNALARLPRQKLLVSEEALIGTMPGHSDTQFYPRQQQLWTALAQSSRLQVHPRIVVRRQDNWIESLYGFRVNRGLPIDFASFVKDFDPARIDYRILLDTLGRFNLLDRTRIGVLEDWSRRGALECALKFLDLPSDADFPRFQRNKRQPPHALPILVSLNRNTGDDLDHEHRSSANAAIRQLDPSCNRDEIAATLEASLPRVLHHHIGNVLKNYDPAMPVKLTDDQRRAWRSAVRTNNREFLAHPTVGVDESIWKDD